MALAVVLQTSDISAAVLAKLRKIGGMIQEGVSGDRGESAVIGFSSEAKVLQDFTHDPNKIDDAFHSLRGSGNASGCMLDALELALNLLSERPHNPRREILSGQRDTGSGKQGEAAGCDGACAAAERDDLLVVVFGVHDRIHNEAFRHDTEHGRNGFAGTDYGARAGLPRRTRWKR